MPIRALLFTDLVDSTLLVGQLGDARSAELWQAHDRGARDLLAEHRGREIDRTDGFFALFEDAVGAAGFALAYQRLCAELGLSARVGAHVGPVTLRSNDAADVARGAKPLEVEGLAKPFAARVMALARGGQTLLSAAAREALAAAGLPAGVQIESLGHYRLKGVEAPAELFEIGPAASASFAPPPDGDKAYRVVADGPGQWRPAREVRHNLAAERDAFVGRGAELRALAQRLDAGARLVTVVGPGGTGKTRLATRYARTWLGDWPGGVAFCDLSEARSPEGIHHALALAMDVPLLAGDAVAQLGHALAARGRCLVILDNFEQVAAHAAPTLGCWLDRAADASFVVTSRERLHLPGEQVFEVEPLALADEAIELFAVRARAQRSGFEVAPAARSAVAEIVRLLDGLPLAIELAAARVRLLSPQQIVTRLQDRFRLLAGARGAAARPATLKAAIDWAWDLLAPWERAALAQCSVFQGGFTLDVAEQVLDLSAWADAPAAMDAVQALLDKSLLRSWQAASGARHDIAEPYFGMYLSIHEYAAAQLEAGAGGAPAVEARRRHARCFAACGSDAALDALSGAGGVARHRLLALELDNLVVACRRSLADGAGGLALACCRAAWAVLDWRGPFALGATLADEVLALGQLDEAGRAAALLLRVRAARRLGRSAQVEAWLQEALRGAQAAADARTRAEVLAELGHLHQDRGRGEESLRAYEAALALQREHESPAKVAALMGNLGNHHVQRGELEAARDWYERALAEHRALGNRRGEATVLGGLAVVHHDLGETARALPLYEAALEVLRETGDRMSEGIVLGNLATLHNDLGRLAEAEAAYEATIALVRDIGDRIGEAVTLGNLGKLRHDFGRFDDARRDYQASLAIAREAGHRRTEGVALAGIGTCDGDQGRHAQALARFDEALAVHRATGNRRFEGEALANRGDMLARLGRWDEARAALAEGEALLREIGDAMDLAKLLCLRGRVQAEQGALPAAAAALHEAEALAATLGAQPESELGQLIGRLHARLA